MPRAIAQVLFIVVPLAIAFALLPGVFPNQLMLFNFVIFLTLAQGVNVLYGFTGYLPFGYVGFFGAGAYGFSLAVMHLQSPALPALICAGAAALLLGVILTPLLRLTGAYFSIASLAASLAVLQLIANPALEPITRGPYGVALRGVFDPKLAYATAVGLMAATMLLVVWLRNSQFGLSLQALREDAVSAAMAGIDVVRARMFAWMLSAVIAGLAGGVYAWYVSVFYPETVFGSEFSIFAIVFALFGGVSTLLGPILGVLILYGMYNVIGVSTPQYFQLIYGVLIMVVVLFLPNGLISLLTRRGARAV